MAPRVASTATATAATTATATAATTATATAATAATAALVIVVAVAVVVVATPPGVRLLLYNQTPMSIAAQCWMERSSRALAEHNKNTHPPTLLSRNAVRDNATVIAMKG